MFLIKLFLMSSAAYPTNIYFFASVVCSFTLWLLSLWQAAMMLYLDINHIDLLSLTVIIDTIS